MFLMAAASFRAEFNCVSKTVREIALGNNLKKFLSVITALWVLSIVGSWFNFLTLCYLVFVMALTMPALYEKNEDTFDEIAGKALDELKKQRRYSIRSFSRVSLIPSIIDHNPQFAFGDEIALYFGSPPDFPKITLPEDMFLMAAASFRAEFNCVSKTVREIALGNNLKKFLSVITAFWVLSIVGSWFDFLTLCYLVFVMALTMPALYEKNEDTFDEIAGKALDELKKQETVLDQKFLPSFTHPKHH